MKVVICCWWLYELATAIRQSNFKDHGKLNGYRGKLHSSSTQHSV